MTSLAASPILETPPRIRQTVAEADLREADLVVELGNRYSGVELYDWQKDVVRCWFARVLNHNNQWSYAHSVCGLIVPRQNGKSKAIIITTALAKAMLYGENVVYTSHRVDSMLEIFELLVDIVGDNNTIEEDLRFPEIHRTVKRVVHTNGHLAIIFKNGGAISFAARSKGSIRGKSIDCIFFDEAQYLTKQQFADVAPALSASGSPQIIYAGTPPDYEDSFGEVFGIARANAINEKTGLCWHEWSVEEIGDIYDKSRWYETNPSLGHSLDEHTIETNELYGGMGEEEFARERLAFWAKQKTEQAVNKEIWLDTRIDKMPDKFDKMCIGVKFSPNGSEVAISVATLVGENKTFGQLIQDETKETATGLDWLVKTIHKQMSNTSLVAIDGKSGAEDLKNRLIKAGVSKNAVKVMTPAEVVSASTMLNSSLEDDEFKHIEDRRLDLSAMTSKKRKIGTDGYGFGGDSIPIESLAAALWAVRTTKRNPNRKMRII